MGISCVTSAATVAASAFRATDAAAHEVFKMNEGNQLQAVAGWNRRATLDVRPQLLRTSAAACLAVIPLLLALSSDAAAVQVKLGMRVYLAKVQVTSMQASLPNGPAIAPGEKSPLVVRFTQPDGKILLTEGKGKGKVMWRDLTVTPTVVTANNKGVLTSGARSQKK